MIQPAPVDTALEDGLSTDSVLGLTAAFGLLGWLATQYVAWNPGMALERLGFEGATVLVAGWAVLTISVVLFGAAVAARAVRYSPPMWIWLALIAVAFVCNGLVITTDLLPQSVGRYLLWHPWMGVYLIGYLLTGVIAVDRNRLAYVLGASLAGLVLLTGVLFPLESRSWIFALTAGVHAVPLVLDAASQSTDVTQPTLSEVNQ